MSLSPLGGGPAELLATRVAGGRRLPPDVVEQVVRRTDGIPLFIGNGARRGDRRRLTPPTRQAILPP